MTRAADLASRWLGGSVMAASDESFGEKEHLLDPAPAAFEPGRYGPRGEIVDGWETRRRRGGGNDWALIRLGAAGILSAVDLDTSFFTGNHPESASVTACGCQGYPGPAELDGRGPAWTEVIPRTALRGDAHHVLPVTVPWRFTHLRLSIFPDGGVARLRALGTAVPDPRELDGLTIDLASQRYGGAVVHSSDDFYTAASVLNRPGEARTMGEGWETRRRRDDGHDFVILRLALAGHIRQLIVDTAQFRYNASAQVEAYGCAGDQQPPPDSPAWQPLLARTSLQPDTRHVLPVRRLPAVTWIRLDAFPDGGLSRLRVIGSIDPAARRQAGYRWLNALPPEEAAACLRQAGLPADLAADIAGQRPLPQRWLDELRAGTAATTAHLAALASMLEGPPAADG